MASIGDLFFRLLADSTGFKADVERKAAVAGTAGGAVLGKNLGSGALKELRSALSPKKILGDIATGAGIGGGIAIFNELGRAISNVAGFFPELIAKGQAYAVNIEEIMQRTGASAEASSNLAASLTFLGIPIEGIGLKLSMMAKQVFANEKNFARLKIATRDANGQFLDGVAILDNIRQRYQSLGAGIERAAIAQQLIGRGGGELLQFLNLSNRQVADLTAEWKKLGLILDEAGVQRAKDVQHEQALLGLALTGLGNRLFQTVAPAILAITDAFVNLVETKGPEIEAFFVRVAGYVLGLVKGFTGIDMSASDTFVAHLDLAKNAIQDTTDAAGQQADATKAATAALNAESAALDRQAAKLTKTAAAEELLFQRKLRNLAASVAAQLASMDADQKAAEVVKQRAQFTQDLADAQLALAEAQGQARTDQLTGNAPDIKAISEAQQQILDVKARAAEFEASLVTDARRAELEATKQYVEDVASLEAGSADKRSLAHTFGAREKALTLKLAADKEKGDLQAVADDEIRLEAVRTAKARAESGTRLSVEQTELAAKKKAIAGEIAALGKVPPVVDTITRATDGEMLAIEGVSGSVTGKGGLIEAIKAAAADGEEMGRRIHDALVGPDGTGGVVGAIGSVADALGHIFDAITKAWNLIPGPLQGIVGGAVVGGAVGGLPGAAVGAVTGGAIQLGAVNAENEAQQQQVLAQAQTFITTATLEELKTRWAALAREKESILRSPTGALLVPQINLISQVLDLYSKEIAARFSNPPTYSHVPTHATGLWNSPADHIALIHRREMVVPPAAADVFRSTVPALAFGAAAGGGVPAIIRVEIGGNPLLDYIDRGLRYRRR